MSEKLKCGELTLIGKDHKLYVEFEQRQLEVEAVIFDSGIVMIVFGEFLVELAFSSLEKISKFLYTKTNLGILPKYNNCDYPEDIPIEILINF